MLEVCVAIIQKDNKFLICQRSKDDFFSNIWEFPGGKKEAHESSEECIQREIQEELEIQIEIIELYAQLIYEVRGKEILFKFYLASTNETTIAMNVHQDHKWVSAQDFAQYPFMEADKEVLEMLKTR